MFSTAPNHAFAQMSPIHLWREVRPWTAAACLEAVFGGRSFTGLQWACKLRERTELLMKLESATVSNRLATAGCVPAGTSRYQDFCKSVSERMKKPVANSSECQGWSCLVAHHANSLISNGIFFGQ